MNYIDNITLANGFNHEVKTHRDYTDVSFYEDNSKITKIDLQALIPVPNDDPDYGVVTTPEDFINISYNSLLYSTRQSKQYGISPILHNSFILLNS